MFSGGARATCEVAVTGDSVIQKVSMTADTVAAHAGYHAIDNCVICGVAVVATTAAY